MLLETKDRLTGLPLAAETRNRARAWFALPRHVQDFADPAKPDAGQQTWVPDWQQWAESTIQRVRCWKCGTDIKAWRMMLDHKGRPVKIGPNPAVAFLLLPTFRQTVLRAHLPQLDRRVSFSALHCGDCEVRPEHGMEALTCYLQGVDAGLKHAWACGHAKSLTPDHWASYLVRWSKVEPAGMEDSDMTSSQEDKLQQVNDLLADLRQSGYDRLQVPGEILTTARYLMDYDQSRYSQIPAGVIVDFDGDTPPPGWEWYEEAGRQRIRKL